MQKLLNIFFVGIIVFGGALFVHAQTTDTLGTSVQFSFAPEAPGPQERVVIEAQGVGGFLGDATITWQQDGKTVLSGVGERTFSFTTGNVGTKTLIHIVINSPSQGTFTKDFTFVPGLIHLLWEANTSAPPLYRGKSLYSPGSLIKVVALPQVVINGSYIGSNSLSFKWSVNDQPVTAQSGLGRSTLTYNGNQLNQSETIAVDVFFGAALVGRAGITIPATEPGILFYVKDPLRGTLFDQALPAAISLAGQEVTLQAEPYYFANESFTNKTITYLWTLSGQEVAGPESEKGVLTLRQSGSGQGQSLLAVELQNTDTFKFLQAASVSIRIMFGQQTNKSSGFGI